MLVLTVPLGAAAQSFVNPDSTQQPGDIYLQNTYVYYTPMYPPGDSDTRENLSNQSMVYRDPNGVGDYWHTYMPVIYDSAHHKFDTLQNWQPPGDAAPLGVYAHWQRFFTARTKWNHSSSDIIAGSHVTTGTDTGKVIVSKNEDVDFRASGTVKLENGFHVMPGAFFHAYQEPKFDSVVFSDEFDDTAKFHNQWSVSKGFGDNYGIDIAECSSDSNARLISDTQAHDGHALDLILREIFPDTCECSTMYAIQNCVDSLNPNDHHHLGLSSALLHTCPFPYTIIGTQRVPAYQKAPYGKYEVREKIPHVRHHTNNWSFADGTFEYDINETWNSDMSQLHPGAGQPLWHGPCKGIFGPRSMSDTTPVLRCSAANWCASNSPTQLLFLGNFTYGAAFNLTNTDTFLSGSFPNTFSHSRDSITFYYHRQSTNTADSLTWTVTTDGRGVRRIFSAPYHILHGTSLVFSKDYQPTSITMHDSINSHGDTLVHTYSCHWVDSLNDPTNYGKIRLDTFIGNLVTNSERYIYTVTEGLYPTYPYYFDGNDTSGGYEYHTFAMELLPNEVRLLMDSNVVWRSPDRMVSPGNKYFNWASWIPRSPVGMNPAEEDIDLNPSDSLGSDTTTFMFDGVKYWNSITGRERQSLDHAASVPGWPGVWDVTIGGRTYHAAHHVVDYVKIWGVPANMNVPDFPH